MIEKMFALLKKPLLWQRSSEPFWDHEHISKGLLEAHLNPHWEAASRKHSDIERSVQWLSTVFVKGAKILDLGCGPGLYTKRLSEMGYDVTGIDYSKRSIAYAKSQDTKTNYIYKNYLELDYAGVFDAITLIYCDYGALTLSERKTLLPKVCSALKPGGLFIFDVFTMESYQDKRETKTWSVCENGCFWDPQRHICFDATCLYEDSSISVDQHIVITNDSIHEYLTWDTAYTMQGLADELSPFGFEIGAVFDDVCGKPYTGEGDTLCFVAIKQADAAVLH